MAEERRPAAGLEEMRRIAKLAHLELAPGELERVTAELERILAHVKQLEELSVDDVPPTAHVQIERIPLRADEPHAGLAHDLALREAPKVAEGGFAVPAFVDEG
jgi:aspartyl-tRNA(Asn)/glutamyl-tRNA(Gln) amidotransferase subunit C